MIPADTPTPVAALILGSIHAATPCAHSWPVLVPFVARFGSALRPGLLFSGGMLLSSVTAGAMLGAAGGWVEHEAGEVVEIVTAVLVVLIGAAFLLRPRWIHAGHLHGTCLPAEAVDDGARHTADDGHGHGSCEHAGHHPSRFMRFGPNAGIFLLGFSNMLLPCWSNGPGAALAVHSGGIGAGACVLGLYGAAAGLTMIVLLHLVRRGMHLMGALSSPRTEAWLLRGSGALMIAWGASLLIFPSAHAH